MKKGGIGVGSASIVLVFAVLCLTVFSLITYIVAGNSKALVDAESQLVEGYYKADAFAEYVISDIFEAGTIPDTVRGIRIETDWDDMLETEIAYFSCPISEQKALYVSFAVYEDRYEILSWRMWDTDDWVIDDHLNVWSGEDE